jgi:hypothetical protein
MKNVEQRFHYICMNFLVLLTVSSSIFRLADIKWFLFQKQLYQVVSVALTDITITAYNISAGTKVSSDLIHAPWMAQDSRYYFPPLFFFLIS